MWMFVTERCPLLAKVMDCEGYESVEQATELMLNAFASAVYSVIFCDWLAAPPTIMDANIRKDASCSTTFGEEKCNYYGREEGISFYSSLIHAQGMIK